MDISSLFAILDSLDLTSSQSKFINTLKQQINGGRKFFLSRVNASLFPGTPIEDLVQHIVDYDNDCQNGLNEQLRSEMVGFVILTYTNTLIQSRGNPLIDRHYEGIIHGLIQGWTWQ